jgi:dihydrofolate reductase
MTKLIVFENVSVDGYFSGPNGEYDWGVMNDEITQYVSSGGPPAGGFLFGRVTYDLMASFWPTDAGRAMNPTFADGLNNAPKVVFSKSLKEATWQGTTVARGINPKEIHKLKQEAAGDLMIFGSGSIVAEMTRLGLVDEYQFMLTPIVLGGGRTVFENVERAGLQLTDTHVFDCGVVQLKYVPSALPPQTHPKT